MQDFGFTDLQDLANMIDKMAKAIVDPIVDAVNTFKRVINFFKNGGLKKIFNALKDTVKNLPMIFVKASTKLAAFINQLFDFNKIPWIEMAKKLFKRITTFVTDVQQDVTNFYQVKCQRRTIPFPFCVFFFNFDRAF